MDAIRAALKAEIMAELAEQGALKDAGFITEPKKPDLSMMHAAPNVREGRTWVILAENKNIPRGGQFFGCNGSTYLLRPGRAAHVPNGLIDILDNAIESIPIVDPDTLIIVEYRDQLRYPYRVVSGPSAK